MQSVTVHYSCWSRAGADPQGRVKQNQVKLHKEENSTQD